MSMSQTKPLNSKLTQSVLRRFGLPQDMPANKGTLEQLLDSYTCIVPLGERLAHCAPRAASCTGGLSGFRREFWDSMLANGAGGTCYESNYAFLGLLKQLNFEGYLTINDMGASIGCHSAIVIWLDGQKHLVDVGLPLYAVLPFPAAGSEAIESPYFRYTIKEVDENRHMITRHPHPRCDAFLLVDEPVADEDYCAITIHDYRHEGGQFLGEIVIHKVIDGQLWRFNSDDRPLHLQQFIDGQRRNHPLDGDVVAQLSDAFEMDREIVAEAMRILELP